MPVPANGEESGFLNNHNNRDNNEALTLKVFRRLWLLIFLVPAVAQGELLIGVGQVNGVVGPNLEWGFEHSSIYAIPGGQITSAGWNAPDDFRWVVGARRRIDQGQTTTSGFFAGAMVGDLGAESRFERLGVGGEFGYQWVTPYLRWTLSSGVAILEDLEEKQADTAPLVIFGASVSFRR